ncbi:glycerophosphodiester phosphodiesterase family protein, partial [Kineococcus glutinatus]|uniref:glycerophosphodiester phosphodiesterase family protein n=1 Tax=Kineococcus glutinatus TaxID=1070872 RepID=UPI0031E965A4
MAHRGFSRDGLENTLVAFGAAVDLGYRYLETDVHATADGQLVAFHDEHLDRVSDARGRIAALPWERVRRARVGGREPVPLLAEVLDAFPGVHVNVDVKDAAAVGPLVEVVRRTAAARRVCVASFAERRRRAALAA